MKNVSRPENKVYPKGTPQYMPIGPVRSKLRNKVYLGTNTKMYKSIAETVSYLQSLEEMAQGLPWEVLELFVIPSYTALEAASKYISGDHFKLGAQNMCWEDHGQFTGEISPIMLKEVGVRIIELGHSERRHTFGETDEMVNKKVHCALKHNFTALLCIGDTKEQKEYHIEKEILQIQLKKGLYGVPKEKWDSIWIAYEPVWAIGTSGIPASAEWIASQHRAIRETLAALFGETYGTAVPILYGGSVNAGNAEEIIALSDVDGLFIGRSAWDAGMFVEIIRKVLRVSGKL